MLYSSQFPGLWLAGILALACLTVSFSSLGQQSESSEQAIQFLLEYVAESGLTFIRNSERQNAADAAQHMKHKYQHFMGKIESPEDFIERCASKSLLSGKHYLVIMKNGKEAKTTDWLLRALEKYRNQHAGVPG